MGKIHFCSVGCGDCTVIDCNAGTILIDCFGIDQHAHLLPSNKFLPGVFVTHPHRDHFGGLQYLRSNGYRIGNLIYSPYSRRRDDHSLTYQEWTEFNDHANYFKRYGTTLSQPYREHVQGTLPTFWQPSPDVGFCVLGPFMELVTSPTREVHDASLVLGVYTGSRKFVVTGDASDANLNSIAQNTNNFCNDVLQASHHGSINGADLDFIKAASPQHTVISTQSGVHSNVPHPTALQRYRDNTSVAVRRTDVDGTWMWEF